MCKIHVLDVCYDMDAQVESLELLCTDYSNTVLELFIPCVLPVLFINVFCRINEGIFKKNNTYIV